MFESLINELDLSKSLIIFTIIILIIASYLILISDIQLFYDESYSSVKKMKKIKLDKDKNCKKEKEQKVISINGYLMNEKQENFFKLNEKTKKIEDLHLFNNNPNKNEQMSNMLLESISSLNCWKNDELGNEIFKKTNWNLDKQEDDSIVSHYVYPNIKMNLSSSHSSLNSNIETDGEDEIHSYKLGICRKFLSEKIRSNIVKEVNNKYFQIYSQGDPTTIKSICKSETIPLNFDDIMKKYDKDGYKIIGLAGKRVKMNYLQSQKI